MLGLESAARSLLSDSNEGRKIDHRLIMRAYPLRAILSDRKQTWVLIRSRNLIVLQDGTLKKFDLDFNPIHAEFSEHCLGLFADQKSYWIPTAELLRLPDRHLIEKDRLFPHAEPSEDRNDLRVPPQATPERLGAWFLALYGNNQKDQLSVADRSRWTTLKNCRLPCYEGISNNWIDDFGNLWVECRKGSQRQYFIKQNREPDLDIKMTSVENEDQDTKTIRFSVSDAWLEKPTGEPDQNQPDDSRGKLYTRLSIDGYPVRGWQEGAPDFRLPPLYPAGEHSIRIEFQHSTRLVPNAVFEEFVISDDGLDEEFIEMLTDLGAPTFQKRRQSDRFFSGLSGITALGLRVWLAEHPEAAIADPETLQRLEQANVLPYGFE